jgi:hypothetical protein
LTDFRFFLGGHDLEMVEIIRLIDEAGLDNRIVDKRLAWGAMASAYRLEIEAALAAGERLVLVELCYDLPPAVDRAALIEVDHHGERAGKGRPSSLRQMFDLLKADGADVAWTRRRQLVAANDVGHARGLRALGATAEEIRALRDADRAAQGVGPAVEAQSRRAIAAARRSGDLLLVETEAPTASAIMDFLLPEYGGPSDGPVNTLVVLPKSLAFFGRGDVVAALSPTPGCWFGGDLPDHGFWGLPRPASGQVDALVRKLSDLVNAGRQRS